MDDTVELGIPKLSTLPRTTKLDKYIANLIKANREAYKGILQKKYRRFFICSSEDYKNNLKQLYSIMIKLIDIVKEVDKRLMEEKMKEIHILFPTQSILPLIFYLVLTGIKS